MLNVQLLIINHATRVSGPTRRVGARLRVSMTLTLSSHWRPPSCDRPHFGARKLPTPALWHPHFRPAFNPLVHPQCPRPRTLHILPFFCGCRGLFGSSMQLQQHDIEQYICHWLKPIRAFL